MTYATQTSKRVMRWRLYIEEYSPDLRYIKGENNIVADALSRLDIKCEPLEEAFFTEELRAELYAYQVEDMTKSDYPLQYQQIGIAQAKDSKMNTELKKTNSRYDTTFHCSRNSKRISLL